MRPAQFHLRRSFKEEAAKSVFALMWKVRGTQNSSKVFIEQYLHLSFSNDCRYLTNDTRYTAPLPTSAVRSKSLVILEIS